MDIYSILYITKETRTNMTDWLNEWLSDWVTEWLSDWMAEWLTDSNILVWHAMYTAIPLPPPSKSRKTVVYLVLTQVKKKKSFCSPSSGSDLWYRDCHFESFSRRIRDWWLVTGDWGLVTGALQSIGEEIVSPHPLKSLPQRGDRACSHIFYRHICIVYIYTIH